MISPPTSLPSWTKSATARAAPLGTGLRETAAGRAILQRVATILHDWAATPALPHAALWEASVVTGMLLDAFEPDPFATEPPCLGQA